MFASDAVSASLWVFYNVLPDAFYSRQIFLGPRLPHEPETIIRDTKLENEIKVGRQGHWFRR